MKEISQWKINKTIKKHKKWLDTRDSKDYCSFSNCNLDYAVFKDIDLSLMSFEGASLRNARFENCILENANFSNADLSYSTFLDCNCQCTLFANANMKDSDLDRTDFSFAIMTSVNLQFASVSSNFSNAILNYADVRNAHFKKSYFKNAEVNYIVLVGANLENVIDFPYIPLNIPEGEVIVWKKVKNFIIKMKLLEDSKRSRATSNKCRCDKALVLEIQTLDGKDSGRKRILNENYSRLMYEVGKVAYSDFWDDNRWRECSNGIHFFLDRQTAVNYERF